MVYIYTHRKTQTSCIELAMRVLKHSSTMRVVFHPQVWVWKCPVCRLGICHSRHHRRGLPQLPLPQAGRWAGSTLPPVPPCGRQKLRVGVVFPLLLAWAHLRALALKGHISDLFTVFSMFICRWGQSSVVGRDASLLINWQLMWQPMQMLELNVRNKVQ